MLAFTLSFFKCIIYTQQPSALLLTAYPPPLEFHLTFSSVQFTYSVMFDSLWPHGLQHARLLCPSQTPRVYPNSCPLSLWCHPTISSSVIPFSSCFQSFPASGSFPIKRPFAPGGQRIIASASVLPINIQDRLPLGLTGLISLQSKGLLRIFSNTTVQKHQFFCAQLSLWSNSNIHTQLQKKKKKKNTHTHIVLTRWTFVGKVMSLLFNMLSRLTIAFLPRNKCLLILWLQSLSGVIFKPRKIKSVTVSIVSPSICPISSYHSQNNNCKSSLY